MVTYYLIPFYISLATGMAYISVWLLTKLSDALNFFWNFLDNVEPPAKHILTAFELVYFGVLLYWLINTVLSGKG
ncbi:MAG: hypothetical protein GX221_01775 [Candidatus Riflebacteria bacterium]|nr:hypothetical protein [Candidatus Riflebacteria bacterium]